MQPILGSRQKTAKKPRPQNSNLYDGFPTNCFCLLVDLGTNPHLVLDNDFLTKLLLPRLVKARKKRGNGKNTQKSSAAGVSQFKAQFDVPRDWFRKFCSVNLSIVLSSKSQYATVWTHAVDCALRSGHVQGCVLNAEQRELETQQVRNLVNPTINHPKFLLRNRADEIDRLENILKQKQKGTSSFRGTQNQINGLKKPMKISNISSLKMMRNINGILHLSNSWRLNPHGPESFINSGAQRVGFNTNPFSSNTFDIDGKALPPRSFMEYGFRLGNTIENTPLHDKFHMREEGTAPRPIEGGGLQRSGNNMIPLTFNRLQYLCNNPIGNISEAVPKEKVSAYETSLAVKQGFPDPFTSKPEVIQLSSSDSMNGEKCRKQILSNLDGLLSEFSPDRNTSETGSASASASNRVFSSTYAASISPFTLPDDSSYRNRSNHGFALDYGNDLDDAYSRLTESIDCHYRYYGPNMQICQEHETLLAESYASNIPSSEAHDEDTETDSDSSEVPLCVGLPPLQMHDGGQGYNDLLLAASPRNTSTI
ncbi:hypothetical protein ACMFMF_004528 [Clarireedia jacksonii]